MAAPLGANSYLDSLFTQTDHLTASFYGGYGSQGMPIGTTSISLSGSNPALTSLYSQIDQFT
ncbi:MAG: hypothetical protein MZU97_09140 [Bacillus subtilis]|nr:hypothetical protein [Bacillus subtilis]